MPSEPSLPVGEDPARYERASLAVVACVLLFAYALARPGVESLFLEVYGETALPWVWAGTMPAIAVAAAGYGALSYRLPLVRVFVIGVAVSAGILPALLLLHRAGFRDAAFALYLWKDVHVVVLLEMFWTFANLTHGSVMRVRRTGGSCVRVPSVGLPETSSRGSAAQMIGTENALLLPLVPLAVLFLAAVGMLRWGPSRFARVGAPSPKPPSFRDTWNVLRHSRFVPWLLGLVLVVQAVITLVDYRYNALLVATFPSVDVRTEVKGDVYAIIDGLSLLLQLGTGWILRGLGVRIVLLGIPVIVASAVMTVAAVPRFAAGAGAKILTKAFDYSLFRAAKEILYIPLSTEEKTRGKAVVDMFGYRTGKAGASLVLGLLVQVGLSAGVVTGAAAGSHLRVAATHPRHRRGGSGPVFQLWAEAARLCSDDPHDRREPRPAHRRHAPPALEASFPRWGSRRMRETRGGESRRKRQGPRRPGDDRGG